MTATSDTRVSVSMHDRIAETHRRLDSLRRPHRGDLAYPPGPPRWVLLQRLLAGGGPSLGFMERMCSYHPVGYLQLPKVDAYFLSDPDVIWQVFTDASLTMKGYALQQVRPVVGDGLLTAEGEVHRQHRAIVQRGFTRAQVNGYVDTTVEATMDVDARWRDQVAAGQDQIMVVDDMFRLALDVVGRALFGSDLTGAAGRVGDAMTVLLAKFRETQTLQWLLTRHIPGRITAVEDAGDDLFAVVADLIAERRTALAAGQEFHDVLSMLIAATDDETGARLSDAELVDEMVTLVIAGFETTAVLLSWTWLLLAEHPQVEQWVRQEWQARDQNQPVTADAIAQLPRTRAVIAESLRVRPPAWTLDRRAALDLEVAGYTIPEGARVVASQWVMHRDPRFWGDDAEAFWPERWITSDGGYDEKAPGAPKGAWFPFGFASRRCIGEFFALTEAAVVLATLGARWQVRPENAAAVTPVPAVALRPSTQIPARIEATRP